MYFFKENNLLTLFKINTMFNFTRSKQFKLLKSSGASLAKLFLVCEGDIFYFFDFFEIEHEQSNEFWSFVISNKYHVLSPSEFFEKRVFIIILQRRAFLVKALRNKISISIETLCPFLGMLRENFRYFSERY